MAHLKTVISQKADDSWIYPPVYEDSKQYERTINLKNKLIRSSIFDSASNGGTYFYSSCIPTIENHTLFQRVNSKSSAKNEEIKGEAKSDTHKRKQKEK